MRRLGMLGWSAVLVAAIILSYLLMVKPVIGMADNGDFRRIMGTVGLNYLDPAASFRDQYFDYMHTQFAFVSDAVGGYLSTHIIVAFLAVWINKWVYPGVFDIRFLSAIYICLLLTAFVCSLRLNLLASWTSKLTFALLFIIEFLDVGYTSYFNSFFGEPIAFIFMLLTIALALRLAEQENPSRGLFIVFCLAAIFLAGSKVQYAPVGLILCVLSLRFWGVSLQHPWKKTIAFCSALLLLVSAAFYILTPKELKGINQYQSVFYGILKDSPSPEQDLREMGLDTKLAVLANTNYFTPHTDIPQQSEELQKNFYSHINHEKIAMFYLMHPARYWQKLQVTASHAMTIRASYLGNYEKADGFERGKITSSFSFWSQFKSKYIPHTLWFICFFYFVYYFIVLQYLRQAVWTNRFMYEVFAMIPMIGVVAFLVPLLGDGEADMEKHLFLFNVCFDLMLLISLVWLIHQAARMVRSRVY
ncbi:hypothetical protein [Paenibacillus sp. GP183]|uniref:glycan biosynthesis hexose transferase WsfD n=1 Tax=Paenibacillus sp. GP183 TaxID=1882751 RepID=UPI00089CC783|nr:hypothetical protein [Paenibacillus sp. GP183]SEC05270.1 hypothetical protein SAMN05443246_2806 [Paenibacillus sp. GP183]